MKSNKTPIIGITPRTLIEGTTKKQFVNDSYVNALNSLGFTSIVLTLENQDYETILNLCDGFLITGGVDVDPKWFNEENNGTGEINPRLDIIDKVVIDYAVKTKKPMLGICRGHQVINVFMGGSLIQDIGSSHNKVRHFVKTFSNRLINFPKEMEINSYHHQVVNKLAKGLIPVATSYDDYNEAFIHEDLPIISCQWHPELIFQESPSQLVFNCFKQLVNDYLKTN